MGATGTGKTVAFHSIVRQLMCDPFNRSCFIVLDRLGGLSEDFLTWVASPYALVEAGKLGAFRIGPHDGAIRVSDDQLQAYLDACCSLPHSENPIPEKQ